MRTIPLKDSNSNKQPYVERYQMGLEIMSQQNYNFLAKFNLIFILDNKDFALIQENIGNKNLSNIQISEFYPDEQKKLILGA